MNKGGRIKCPYSVRGFNHFGYGIRAIVHSLYDYSYTYCLLKKLLMATRRRRSTAKVTTTAATSPSIVKETKVESPTIVKETKVVSVKKSSIKTPKRVNKVTQPKVNKVTEVTATPTNNNLDLHKIVKDYPRDAFAIALLPLLLLEALTKEGLKLAGVSL